MAVTKPALGTQQTFTPERDCLTTSSSEIGKTNQYLKWKQNTKEAQIKRMSVGNANPKSLYLQQTPKMHIIWIRNRPTDFGFIIVPIKKLPNIDIHKNNSLNLN